MAPSAPLPLPPPVPLSAFLGDETVQPSNGHSAPVPQLKLPGKSNLRRQSMFETPSPPSSNPPIRHCQSAHGAADHNNGVDSGKAYHHSGGLGGPNSSGNGAGGDAGSHFKRKESKVQWTDSHGKELTEVWEFEPSDTGDSDDEESDSDSSQACTCVIQ